MKILLRIIFVHVYTLVYVNANDVTLSTNVTESATGAVLDLGASGYTNCTVTSSTEVPHTDYFNVSAADQLIVKKPLDLEFINDGGQITTLLVTTECDSDTEVNISVNIEPVNEFAPQFYGAPFATSINENRAVGTSVFRFQSPLNVGDLDQVRYGTIVAFRLHPFQITQFDGRGYFELNSTSGVVSSRLAFDYDVMPRKYYILNVSALDDGGWSTHTRLNISISDEDDMPPVFLVSGCSDMTSCHVTQYSAIIDRDFEGVLPLNPGPVLAKDGDTGINAAVKYSLDTDGLDTMKENIEIDADTGQLTIVTSYNNVTNVTDDDMFQIEMTILAMERTHNRFSSNVTLTVTVYRHLPTSPKPTSSTHPGNATEKMTSNDDDDVIILVVEIAVPCIIAIAIGVVIIIVVVKKKKRNARESVYNVKEAQRPRSDTLDTLKGDVISMLSSSPINAYEMMSVYAKMPQQPSSSGNDLNSPQNATMRGDESPHLNEPSDKENLYAIVDKRKTRKRAVCAMNIKELDASDLPSVQTSQANASYVVENEDMTNDGLGADVENEVQSSENEAEIAKPETPRSEYETVNEEGSETRDLWTSEGNEHDLQLSYPDNMLYGNVNEAEEECLY